MTMKLIAGIGLATALSLSAASAKEQAGQKFITKAIEGNLAEVAMGQLAQQNGNSDGVRNFGQQLVTDHSAANQKAISIAGSMGVTAPTEPNRKQKADYQKLSKLSGEAFDRQFAKHMVADHKKDIAEYRKEARANDPAAGYASETLPTLQKHLELAQSLDRNSKARSR